MAHGAVASLPRQVVVELLSWRDELLNVVRLSAAVVVGVWLYLAAAGTGAGDVKKSLLPYQGLIRDRSSLEQRMFRELQEGLLEAETARSQQGTWPAVDALVENGIPPFAPDPTAKGARYTWTMRRDGTYINYLGLPAEANAPAWLVLVQEPEPGTPPDQNFEDEEHHKLLDGIMLHVSTWSHAAGSTLKSAVVRVPQAEGWQQLYAVGPAAQR